MLHLGINEIKVYFIFFIGNTKDVLQQLPGVASGHRWPSLIFG
jgi:hypothetical protein